MKQELDELLCKRYPKIFRDRRASMQVTAMCWGFDCGDGWFNILNQSCRLMQSHIDWSRKNRARALRYNRALRRALRGDRAGLEHYYLYQGKLTDYGRDQVERDIASGKERSVPDAVPQIIAVQIKEKFGTLRFYTDGGDQYTRGVLAMAECMSAVTCEECGNCGKVRTSGWHRTLCDEHAVAAGYSIEEDDDDDLENSTD